MRAESPGQGGRASLWVEGSGRRTPPPLDQAAWGLYPVERDLGGEAVEGKRAKYPALTSDHTKLLTDLGERRQGAVEVFGLVRRGQLDADARLPLRHHRVAEA